MGEEGEEEEATDLNLCGRGERRREDGGKMSEIELRPREVEETRGSLTAEVVMMMMMMMMAVVMVVVVI